MWVLEQMREEKGRVQAIKKQERDGEEGEEPRECSQLEKLLIV
jgi:hypothetical protein